MEALYTNVPDIGKQNLNNRRAPTAGADSDNTRAVKASAQKLCAKFNQINKRA